MPKRTAFSSWAIADPGVRSGSAANALAPPPTERRVSFIGDSCQSFGLCLRHGVAVEVSDRIGVMYAGKLVELGGVEAMVDKPKHPYTRGLLASTVHGGMRGQRLEAIPGAPPDLAEVPTVCSFAARCKYAEAKRMSGVPPLSAIGDSHLVRCVVAA